MIEPHQIRWMIRADMPQVVAIDAAAGEGWDEDVFLSALRKQNCIALVADIDRHVVAFMLYELHRDSACLLRLVVSPEHQAQYVGATMLDRLKHKVNCHPCRKAITAVVNERNLGAQKFLAACGFRAVHVLRDEYGDGDGIAFEWRKVAANQCHTPTRSTRHD